MFKQALNKACSILLVATLLISGLPMMVSVQAQEDITSATDSSNIAVGSNGGISGLIANSLEEEATEQDEGDITNKILSVKINDKVATVSFNNSVECKIIVAIYDEVSNLMVGSGMDTFNENTNIADITLDIETMPNHFVVKVFILDAKNNPLNKSFESIEYTQAHQDFLAKTTEDFQGEEILNLDDDITNNFAVFEEQIIKIEETENNTLSLSDDKEKVYTFSNVDEKISSLQVGDIFYYVASDGAYIIAKVAEIKKSGADVTVVGEKDLALDEVFSYVKIDTSSNGDGAQVDMSNSDSDVTYEGSEQVASFSRRIGVGASDSASYNWKISKKFNDNVKLTGNLGVSFGVDFKAHIYWGYAEVSLSVKEETKFSIDISGKLKITEIYIADVDIPIGVGDVTVGLDVVFLIEAEGKVAFNATEEATLGFSIDTREGKIEDISKPTTFDSDLQFEGNVFIGLALTPNVEALAGIVKIKVDGEVGAEISVETRNRKDTDTEKHLCDICLDGEVKGIFKFKVGLAIEFFDWEDTKEVTITEIEFKILDFYYSPGKGWGIGTCPNNEYRHTLMFYDSSFKPVAGVEVNGEISDSNGELTIYLTKGTHSLKAQKDLYTQNIKLKVSEAGKSVHLFERQALQNSNGTVVDGIQPAEIESGKCGHDVYYTLYEDGTLKISGTGAMTESWGGYYSSFIKNVVIYEGVTSIDDYAFANCENLTQITIPAGITSIGDYAFSGCGNLISITIPNSVTYIGIRAFCYCNSLKIITIPESVIKIGELAFYNCDRLTSINVSKGNTTYISADGVLFDGSCAKLIQFPGGKNGDYIIPNNVTSIGDYAFSDCDSLMSITIPSSVTSIGGRAFLGCSSLKKISFPNSITSIGERVFADCENLTQMTIPDSVTSIGDSAFSNCYSLISITLSDSVTSIGDSAFWDCDSLTSITIPNSVTSIGDYAFYSCDSLTSITIPNSVTSIGNSVFGACDNLMSINVGEGNKSYTSIDGVLFDKLCAKLIQFPCGKYGDYIIPNSVTIIGDEAFHYCDRLISVTIAESIISIGDHTFNDCDSLTSITIPSKVMNIGEGVFANCDSLTNITIPNTVISIGEYAFWGCDNLTNVYYTGTEEQWNEISIGEDNEELLNATIHYNSSGTELATVGTSYTELSAISSNSTTDESAVANTYSRENLVSDTEAVLMVIQGTEEDYEITPSTLLYISQATVDKNGKAEFTTYGDFSDTYYVVLVFGECSHSSYKWTTVNEAVYPDNGLEICVCDYCGEVIDSKEIEVTAPVSQYNLGDANEDGKVNIKDATAIQKHIANLIVLTEKGVCLADATQDGKVNIKDATAIQKHIAGIETGYPIGKTVE